MKYSISCSSNHGVCTVQEDSIEFVAETTADHAFFTMSITFPQWEEDAFLMMPACAYNGNRFKQTEKTYPPMFSTEEAKANFEPLMTNLPALHEDGNGKIQVTAGDMAVPCVGIFYPGKKQGFFLFTQQEVKGKNLGFAVEKGKVEIQYPECRTQAYRMCTLIETQPTCGLSVEKGEKIASTFQIHTFDCDNLGEFYRQFFILRKSLLQAPRAPYLYTQGLWDLMEQHFNEANWSGEYYAEMSKKWQCGWVGGGMSSFPLLKHGKELSKQRARQTLDYLTQHQAPSGFYYGTIREGNIVNDGFGRPGMEDAHLVRKSADSLYFLFKHFAVEPPKPAWEASARRCADALATLFETYGTMGQFVNVETGEMLVGGSSSAAMAPGALAKAGKYFKEPRYLETAQKALEYYVDLFDRRGFTNGGPGEILSAPDSESGFGLLESCVVLYEIDRNPAWLQAAQRVTHYCSTWVVPYAYRFPEGSEFHRLKINTVGSVWANLQNKHSAPGICTLSGDSLYKLYQYTGDSSYLELCKDIAYFIPQCVSTREQPIYSWDIPPRPLPAGYICERVNMSDWEGPGCVGGVFGQSCWPETSLILTYAELMILEDMRD